MEKQKLPNSTAVLVLGILSIPTCCCWGIVGITLAIIALVLANKDTALYNSNPSLYEGYSNIKTGKILAIIGIVLGVFGLISTIYSTFFIDPAEQLEQQRKILEMLGIEQ